MRTIRQFTLSFLMVCLVMLAGFKTKAQDGLSDATFNSGGAGASSTVSAIAVQTDGKILIGGNFTTYNGVSA